MIPCILMLMTLLLLRCLYQPLLLLMSRRHSPNCELRLNKSKAEMMVISSETHFYCTSMTLRRNLQHASMNKTECSGRCAKIPMIKNISCRWISNHPKSNSVLRPLLLPLMSYVRREVKELNEKVTYLDEQVAATRNDLLEFRATAQETLNHITDHMSELVNYINQGGNDKKGKNRISRGPQSPPDDQGRGSGNTGGDNVRTTDIVDKFSGSKSREGRGRGRSSERHSSGNRSGHSKRRRYDSGGPFRRSFEDWLG
ncbi:hypothetical protein F511_11679 [Dorcoceras hygrometricum]|uniref:Uncharacterized protein n=1 Tax=Dorcoceras hygrometricum TaxID=472368 RepID=A0A2Z7B1T9_9LAMI|nr:hypothetical protein F511_11679 [Dorcoceras hygrometricum]